ncbi:hypothetical protein EXM63_04170 [Clostridium botulinum]|uniref:Uncharacterized protein n=1 Tax=Clostridium botulinum TaxID=1491 RepID=A0A6M0T0G9_CLOBO|nr:hypothetical protein [Clostridium botulinum]NFI74510.1 hypothetical protein [Clostridium sporogenes]NFP62149.1 hypothetical protein [Clostridium sporogenes]NFU95430.1 hypothetical protein [Clostridium sporogenes]NFV68250.1 hypothetical protein [Clostridium botulinum]
MEKPILFNTEMVKAILEGKKTCTRRIIKKVSGLDFLGTSSEDGATFDSALFGKGNLDEILDSEIKERIKAPYLPGDILWVRETWKVQSLSNMNYRAKFLYKAKPNNKLKETNVDGETYIKLLRYESKNGWHPSIFMPKDATRIFLKVTNVRVGRLQDITEEGAKAEGATKQIWYQPYGTKSENNQEYVGDIIHHKPNYITGFAGIWDRTLGKWDDWLYSFKRNPWVWVIEFERIEKEENIK